jgi:hypothetical protein
MGSLVIDFSLIRNRALSVELVPKTAWGANLRSVLSEEEWDYVRQSVYKAANYRCQVCGGYGTNWPVECHEEWEWDDEDHIQRLVGLVALCPACHRVKHIGLANHYGKFEEAVNHLMEVNGWNQEQAIDHIHQAEIDCHRRSAWTWELDLSWLKKNYSERMI